MSTRRLPIPAERWQRWRRRRGFQEQRSLVLEIARLARQRLDGARRRRVGPSGKPWERDRPEALGLDGARLAALARAVGGRGVVVRGGRLVYTWGDVCTPGDVASAAKPVWVHCVQKAIETGRLGGFERPVAEAEPRLRDLNPELGFKDRDLTWSHLASQTAGYGVSEAPGRAFDYSDYSVALLADTLVLRVFGLCWERVDEELLDPLLAEPLAMQDGPSWLPFGPRNRPGRLSISPRDFARFGLAYLRGGLGPSGRVIARAAVERLTGTPVAAELPRTSGRPAAMLPGQRSIGGGNDQSDHRGSYSHSWWVNGVDASGRRLWPDAPHDSYGAFGHRARRALVVFPGLDLVISWNDAALRVGRSANRILALAVAAVRC